MGLDLEIHIVSAEEIKHGIEELYPIASFDFDRQRTLFDEILKNRGVPISQKVMIDGHLIDRDLCGGRLTAMSTEFLSHLILTHYETGYGNYKEIGQKLRDKHKGRFAVLYWY